MMGKIITAALFLATVFGAPVDQDQSVEFNIVTSNVRFNASDRFPDERPWSERKYGQIEVLTEVSSNLSTLIGLQEIKKGPLDDVIYGLNGNSTANNSWTYFGVGRDDGVEKGEYAAILYNVNEWSLVNGTYKWLSETPDVPSKSWNASNNRIVTITEFKHLQTGKHINYLNTHYDEKSEEAREKSSYLIGGWIEQIPNDYETYLSGDLNSISSDVAYTTLDDYLADTRLIAYDKLSQGPTYSGFEPGDNQTVIDFIWAPKDANQNGAKTQVETYNVIDNLTPEGFRFSDHRPVVVKFKSW